jgi:hypothetical protein
MKKQYAKNKFLKELEKTPIVQVACEKTGISRNTVYRWRKEDMEFNTSMQEALSMGVELIGDYAESNILNGIRRGDLGATKYFLSHRHKGYNKSYYHGNDRYQDELIKKEKELAKVKAKAMLAKWTPFYPNAGATHKPTNPQDHPS